MNLERMQYLWPIAKVLHEARRDLAWGKLGPQREPWPAYSSSYTHNPIAYVDLALAQADAIELTQRRIAEIIVKLQSPHADKIYLGKGYTKADLILELSLLSHVAYIKPQ